MSSSNSHSYTCLPTIAKIVIFSASLFILPTVYAMEESEVEVSFQKFNQQWMNSLYTMEEIDKRNLTCRKVKYYYRAEYTGYSRTYSSSIKKTNYKETPYIGILNYKEKKFVSHARTFEGALHGPFTLVYEYPVTEIFLFTGGGWRY